MADKDDMSARRDMALGLAMDLRHQRAGRIDEVEAALRRLVRYRLWHAVRTEHDRHAVGNMIERFDEHRALVAQRRYDMRVVDDFVADIDRRTVALDRQFDDPDRAIDPRAETARSGDKDEQRQARVGRSGHGQQHIGAPGAA